MEISRSARIDLRSIGRFISKDNPKAAVSVVQRILKSLEHLEIYPNMGRIGRLSGTRELIIRDLPFIAVYQIRRQFISVLRVMHGARQWP